MNIVVINNITNPLEHPISASYCKSFWSKFRGLMLHPPLQDNQGIVLVEARDSRANTTIHMLFMLFDIAAIWVNSNMEVVDVKLARRWALAIAPQGPARYVIETSPKYAPSFRVGDKVSIENV
jgi:uncharacterized membrane protein (UPF0127 family)